MDFYEFFENLALVIMSYIITSLIFIFVVWGYEGFNRGLTELDVILITTQFIGLGCLVGIPLIIYFLSQFKVIRR